MEKLSGRVNAETWNSLVRGQERNSKGVESGRAETVKKGRKRKREKLSEGVKVEMKDMEQFRETETGRGKR